jgi:hypothetical protein
MFDPFGKPIKALILLLMSSLAELPSVTITIMPLACRKVRFGGADNEAENQRAGRAAPKGGRAHQISNSKDRVIPPHSSKTELVDIR